MFLLALFIIVLMACIQEGRTAGTCGNQLDRVRRLEPPCKPRPVVKVTSHLQKVTPRAVTVYECGGGYLPGEHREKNSLCVPIEKVCISLFTYHLRSKMQMYLNDSQKLH